MARPKKKEKRDRQFNIALTQQELAHVHAKAAQAAMRPAEYARMKLFAAWHAAERNAVEHPSMPAAHLDPLFMAALSRLGNNLNQIARRMNTFNLLPPASLEGLLREIRALIARAVSNDH